MTDLPSLTPSDFASAFQSIHGHAPYAWQARLLEEVAENGTWPKTIAAPTGAGKTAVLDVAVFHLALSANASPRRAAMRTVLAVDRRIIVDQAHARGLKICKALRGAVGRDDPLGRAATRLASISGSDNAPLHVAELRGGMPLESEWAKRPDQPTLLCTTVDQLGSRLLFRGYGVSGKMAPIHAGLLGIDAFLILDEAHLSHAFEQTLETIEHHQQPEETLDLPWKWCTLTATPRQNVERVFELSQSERNEGSIKERLSAKKIIEIPPPYRKIEAEEFGRHARNLVKKHAERNETCPVVAVVVNRVALARDIWKNLKLEELEERADLILLTGRVRPAERDELLRNLLPRLEGHGEGATRPLYVVATQCIEAGADFDFDSMVSQLAPLDALRQRFGRLARSGNRNGRPALGVILAAKEEVHKKAEDPIYGRAALETWNWIEKTATKKNANQPANIDFGPDALDNLLREFQPNKECFSPAASAAPLRKVDLTALTMTSPRPSPDPDPALFLHGEFRDGAEVSIVWRADLDTLFKEARTAEGEQREAIRQSISNILGLLPPRPGEALRLPLWQVRSWISKNLANDASTTPLADVPGGAPDNVEIKGGKIIMRWRGADDATFISASDISPGDVIVVPTTDGGCDEFGWAPEYEDRVMDIADLAAKAYQTRRAALRLHPDLPDSGWSSVAEQLRNNHSARSIAEAYGYPNWTQVPGLRLEFPYGDPNSGAILFAPRGLPNAVNSDISEAATEEDEGVTGYAPILLSIHAESVAKHAQQYGKKLELPKILTKTLHIAALWHDNGKADPRFQGWLRTLGGLPEGGPPIAKSGTRTNPQRRKQARKQNRLPDTWRHEVASVRYAREKIRHDIDRDVDTDLLLWLIGTHHGHGRPFFRHDDESWDTCSQTILDLKIPVFPGPDKLNFDLDDSDWVGLMQKLHRRYGWWGLAFLEACIRLADHRASSEEDK